MRTWKSTLRPLALAALAAMAGWTGSARADQERSPAPESALFRKLDANGDGFVTRAEAKSVRGFDAAFSAADENRDGRLSQGEFIKAESIYERQKAAAYLEDSVITAKVKAALVKDLPSAAAAVSVESYRGRVLLSGFVDDQHDTRRAREIAASVRGVTIVTSALQIK